MAAFTGCMEREKWAQSLKKKKKKEATQPNWILLILSLKELQKIWTEIKLIRKVGPASKHES